MNDIDQDPEDDDKAMEPQPLDIGEIVKRAHELITGDRNDKRGNPLPIYMLAAKLFSAYWDQPMTAEMIMSMLLFIKLARQRCGSNDMDNFIDAAGYADLWGYINHYEGNKV